jgi:hypothetical protein
MHSRCLSPPEDGNRSSFRNIVLSSFFLEYRTMDRVQKPSNSDWTVPLIREKVLDLPTFGQLFVYIQTHQITRSSSMSSRLVSATEDERFFIFVLSAKSRIYRNISIRFRTCALALCIVVCLALRSGLLLCYIKYHIWVAWGGPYKAIRVDRYFHILVCTFDSELTNWFRHFRVNWTHLFWTDVNLAVRVSVSFDMYFHWSSSDLMCGMVIIDAF